ncbi:hypothetical protein ASD64_07185 [Mesorhizobium sp. Root157]|uniref:helix-turn-helix domain-containing protein n=1 Tax=Mesorhizobium sp. Root157 TaxID=1736477 RepID=UPI0006FACCC0|nr:helix-turn-helix domain-containing protein [Mesorhizobium sp. Root157]KQZ87215.1 hypothetical protein ASD64_07185 [Mesorhizobium sp. Root157]
MTDDDRPWLSPMLNRIAEVAGERAALILGRERACLTVFIPKHFRPGHWLPELIGEEAARNMIAAFGGTEIEIPPALAGQMRRRRVAIAEMTRNGYSINHTTRLLGVSRSTVKSHRRRLKDGEPDDDGQGSLF